jgi:GH15 family glucan-1,4-alpha-glucosidase
MQPVRSEEPGCPSTGAYEKKIRRLCSNTLMQPSAIGDYAMVGDTRSAALVSRSGAIDWMCTPRFDAEPIFGRLVDSDEGGSFTVALDGTKEIRRSYGDGSAVIQTILTTSTGSARLVEGMVANIGGALLPQSLLVRRVECLSGDVRVRVIFDPRLGLPGRPPHRTSRPGNGRLICEWGSLAVALGCTPEAGIEPGVESEFELKSGETLTIVMSVADRGPVVWVPAPKANALLADTDEWWRRWSSALDYDGPHREAVVRSLVTLRLLTYSPSGAPVAAPTTSLPEAVGASRNWDYRYAWPRDAAIGLAAFLATGQARLAHTFMHWLLHASRLSRPRLRVLYDIHGKPAPAERELTVSGYRNSIPVRVGNGARHQHQLDVYGWVADAAWLLQESGHRLHGETWRAVAGLADFVAKSWRYPDAGIWEVRGDLAHYIHSKVMAWLALDRIARMARSRRVGARRLSTWESERDAIASWIRAHGVDYERNALVWKSGSKELDASLLILPVVGFEPPDSPLLAGTIDAIRDTLEVEDGLLYRYRRLADGLEGDEGAFLPCSFWLVQALARTGRIAEATEMFGRLLLHANDVGLFSEEIDLATKEPLGNFPQAFTHATVVQAGLALQSAQRVQRGAC